jgi:hypothetical protein
MFFVTNLQQTKKKSLYQIPTYLSHYGTIKITSESVPSYYPNIEFNIEQEQIFTSSIADNTLTTLDSKRKDGYQYVASLYGTKQNISKGEEIKVMFKGGFISLGKGLEITVYDLNGDNPIKNGNSKNAFGATLSEDTKGTAIIKATEDTTISFSHLFPSSYTYYQNIVYRCIFKQNGIFNFNNNYEDGKNNYQRLIIFNPDGISITNIGSNRAYYNDFYDESGNNEIASVCYGDGSDVEFKIAIYSSSAPDYYPEKYFEVTEYTIFSEETTDITDCEEKDSFYLDSLTEKSLTKGQELKLYFKGGFFSLG